MLLILVDVKKMIFLLKKLIKNILCKVIKYDRDIVFFKGKKEQMRSGKRNICICPDEAWNTIEHLLPVMIALRKYSEICLIIYIRDRDLCRLAGDKYNFFSLVVEYSDIVILYGDAYKGKMISWWKNRLHTILERNTIKYCFGGIKIDTIVRVWTDVWMMCFFKEYHKEAKQVAVGHASFYGMFTGMDDDSISWFEDDNKNYADKYIFPDCYAYRGTCSRILNKIRVVGSPAYDFWWRDLLASNLSNENRQVLQGVNKNVLIILPHLADDKKEYFLEDEEKDIFRFVENYAEEYNFIFKFHPRQKKDEIEAYMYKFTNNLNVRCVFDVSTLALVKYVNCAIICGLTTTAMDTVVSDVPTIEFYKECDNGHFYCFGENKYGTFMRKNNLTFYASSYSELVKCFQSIFISNGWSKYKNRYKDFIIVDGNASDRFAKEIL